MEFDFVFDPLVAFGIKDDSDGFEVSLFFKSIAFDLFLATLLPGFGVGGFARVEGKSDLRFLEMVFLACVRPADLWNSGSTRCIRHWGQIRPHWHLRCEETL